MPAVKKFTITPLKFDAKLAEGVTKRRAGGESIAAIAKALKLSTGKVAMALLVGEAQHDTRGNLLDDPPKLARGIAKDRKEGKSWGWLSAHYGITEGCARRAFEAATGQPFTTLDYRRKAGA